MLYANFKRVIAIGVVVFIISFIGSLSASAYSDSYLNDNLPSGISSAVSWDDACRSALSNNINSGNFSNLRAAINHGAAYQTVTWISSESRGNSISPIKVNYGDTRIRLRLNMIVFLCGTMVQPQYNSVCEAVWLGGYQIYVDDQRWVLDPSHGNDRPPNDRAGCMYPAMTYDYRKLYNMKVSSNDFTNVSLASSDDLNGKTVLSMKNPYTRYWFSNPVYFDVIVPGGIKNSGTVRVNGLYRQINGYNHAYPAYGNSYCLSTTQYAQDAWQIDNCPAVGIDYSISVEIIEHYNLTPTLSVSQKTIDVGENKVAGINASFGHDGSTTKTKNNDKYYTVVKYKVPKGQNLVLPAREGIVTLSDNWPCEAIKNINGAVDCQGDLVKTKHTGELQLNQSVTMLNSHTDDVLSSNLQFGDKICYVAMVSAYNQNANHHTFKTSQAQCVTVGKTPKVQVWGGDIKTDKDVITNKTSSANQNVYGSWSEYGIIANGNAESASGAGLSSSFNGRSGVNPRDYNKLTFANTPKFGNFSSTSSVPDNFTLPSVGGTRGNISGNVDVNSLASGEYNAGNVTLTGSKLSVGKSIVIKSSGVVRISGDLLYTDTNDVRQLPQLIIYAKDIIIEPSVGEVNAWLITQKDGYVSTCGVVISFGDWLSGVSESSCGKKQLKVNGPIKTGRLFLRRTYGGKHASSAKNDPNMHPGTPAEIINLRADTYIWAYNNYQNTGAISTMNVRELPPRY